MSTDNIEISHSDILDAMIKYGGGFVSKLATAWQHADYENHTILMKSFEGYYNHYKEWARKMKIEKQKDEDRTISQNIINQFTILIDNSSKTNHDDRSSYDGGMGGPKKW